MDPGEGRAVRRRGAGAGPVRNPRRARSPRAALALAAAFLGAALGAPAEAPRAGAAVESPFARTEERVPCAERHPLRRPYFGDLHVHTMHSLDASTQGTRNRPRDAYRFARGHPLGIQPYDEGGQALRTLRLSRPLDFAAVTDHAELFGERTICDASDLPGSDSIVCRIYRRWPRAAFFLMNMRTSYYEDPERYGFCGEGAARCLEAAHTPWADVQAAAEEAYDRSAACAFTSFVGYEWTGAPGSDNLHRNVIFRNADVPELPISYYEEPTPQGLWRALDAQCRRAGSGCDVLTIPHNSNLSGGRMFQVTGEDGGPLAAAEARERARNEPLVEVMQHKGDSECRLGVGGGAEDELCAFEKLPFDDFQGKYVPWLASEPGASSFARDALALGLVLESRIGENPFRFGLVAGTDTHLGAAGFVDERAHPGHGGAGAPAPSRLPRGLPDDAVFNPGGLAVLYAEENSRDALFAAMLRREAYGTSGPRMVVRFFGGWGYTDALCAQGSFAERGYAGGVPMGGTLGPRPAGAGPPAFAVRALRDPGAPGRPGTKLQRVQIVKGFVEDGEARFAVHEVAGDGQNGASVDPATCEPRGAGFDALCAVWRDPEFDSSQRAVYYARVVENPTCRWSTWVCNARGARCDEPTTLRDGLEACCDPDVPKTVQERAWTSPIWYAPKGRTAGAW